MPSYPDVYPAIVSDVVFTPPELAQAVESGLIVRAIFEPERKTLTVQVLVTTVPNPHTIAERVILTAGPQNPPDPGKDCERCGSFIAPAETACGNCGAVK